jgi:hypothetical protein
MSDLSSTRTMTVEWSVRREGSAEVTSQTSRQEDYHIFVPQRIDVASRSTGETTKIAPQKEILGLRGTAASSPDFIAEGLDFTTVVEVKAPRAHLQQQQSSTAFARLTKFDGVILKRNESRFWARLWENPNDPQKLEVEFDISELYGSEEKIAQEGAPIVWTIGYAVDRGTRKRESILYVRRVPPVSGKEAVSSRVAVKEKMSRIRWKTD